jgi:hypothetical protein
MLIFLDFRIVCQKEVSHLTTIKISFEMIISLSYQKVQD